MTAPKAATLAFLAALALAPPAAHALPPIASPPPRFHIYDVDKRERNMRNLINELAGGPTLDHRQAEHAYATLNAIQRREKALRGRHGGRLTVSTIRYVDARLNALSRRLGLREPAY